MVGREITELYPPSHRRVLGDAGAQGDQPAPESRRARRSASSCTRARSWASAACSGSGRSELLLSIFGAESIVEGEIEVDGKKVQPRGPRTMMGAGIGLLTEDRKVLGILPELSIRENVTIASLRRGSRKGLLPGKEQADEADKLLDSLRLRAGSYEQPVSTLSGGNQQKVLLARWLLTKPKVLVFDEPTKGIDVGAKGEIYKVIGDLAARRAGHHRRLLLPARAAGAGRPGAGAAGRRVSRRARPGGFGGGRAAPGERRGATPGAEEVALVQADVA